MSITAHRFARRPQACSRLIAACALLLAPCSFAATALKDLTLLGTCRIASAAAVTVDNGASLVIASGATFTVSAGATLDTPFVLTAQLAQPDGVATLDAAGKLLADQLPPIALSQYLGNVASEAAMLALTGNVGDWCFRSDAGNVFMLSGQPAASVDNWIQLGAASSGVTSVAGLTGAIAANALRGALSLDNVANLAPAALPISNATQAALDAKADTSALGTAAALDVSAAGDASATQVVKGNDSRLSDARTPASHTHPAAQISDATITGRALVNAASAAAARTAIGAGTSSFDGAYGSLSGRPTLGTAAALAVPASGNAAASEVVLGSDTRLSDARTPAAHTQAASTISDSTATGRSVLTATDAAAARTAIGAGTSSFDGAYSSLSGRPTLGTAAALNVPASGNAATGEVVKGSDTRLADSRTPVAHAHFSTALLNVVGPVFNVATDYAGNVANAIAACAAAGGGTVYVTDVYTLSSAVTISSSAGIRIVGSDRTRSGFKTATQAQGRLFTVSGSNVTFENLSFDGSYVSGATVGGTPLVDIADASNVTLRNCAFKNVLNAGLAIRGGSNDCQLLDCTFSNFYLGLYSTSINGTPSRAPQRIAIRGCHFLNGWGGDSADAGALKLQTAYADNVWSGGHVVANNQILNAGQMGIELWCRVGDSSVVGNTVSGTTWGISTNLTRNVTVSANTVKLFTYIGLEFAEGCIDSSAIGNVIDGYAADGTTRTGQYGILTASTTSRSNRVNIVGGSVKGCATFGVMLGDADSPSLKSVKVTDCQQLVAIKNTDNATVLGNELSGPCSFHVWAENTNRSNTGLTILGNAFYGTAANSNILFYDGSSVHTWPNVVIANNDWTKASFTGGPSINYSQITTARMANLLYRGNLCVAGTGQAVVPDTVGAAGPFDASIQGNSIPVAKRFTFNVAASASERWYKVFSADYGLPLTLALHVFSNQLDATDNKATDVTAYVAASPYGQDCNVMKLPDANYNGGALKGIRYNNPGGGAVHEVWLHLAATNADNPAQSRYITVAAGDLAQYWIAAPTAVTTEPTWATNSYELNTSVDQSSLKTRYLAASSIKFPDGTSQTTAAAGGLAGVNGTANEITATGTGTVTLSLPTALTFTGKTVTGGTFTGLAAVNTAALKVLGSNGLIQIGGTTANEVGIRYDSAATLGIVKADQSAYANVKAAAGSFTTLSATGDIGFGNIRMVNGSAGANPYVQLTDGTNTAYVELSSGNLRLVSQAGRQVTVSGGTGIAVTGAVSATTEVKARPATATHGYVQLTPGTASAIGYVEWYKPGPTRIGYLGYGDAAGSTTNLRLTLEAGAAFEVGGALTASGAVRFSNYGAGTATFDSAGNITSTSDELAKNILRPFTTGLAAVRKLQPQLYTWRPETGLVTDDVNASLMARDLLAAGIPEAVFTERTVPVNETVTTTDLIDAPFAPVDFKTGEKATPAKLTVSRTTTRAKLDANGKPVTQRVPADRYTVSDRAVIAALVNAVKDLAAQNDDLSARLTALEKKQTPAKN